MIGRLKGILIHKAPPWLVVDVHGVGYELEAPMSTFYDLPEVGREVFLFVHHAQKEDSVSLYGFLRESERRLFRDVQKVSGIGAKIALAVLSGVSVDEFARLLQASDVAALTRIPGIGKKTAERMVVELRDRAAGMTTGLPTGTATLPHDPLSEAITALPKLEWIILIDSEGVDDITIFKDMPKIKRISVKKGQYPDEQLEAVGKLASVN